MTNGAPYLSVVATARNDNHGGNFLERMQLFVHGLLEQCRRYQLSAELVIAEWNPLPDRPRLAEALTWRTNDSPCAVRIIEIPNALHRRYKHGETLPVYQMIGKNVAIRRARGEFVLATNVDILFSNELMQFLARRGLDPRRMYRIDRTDAPADVPTQATLDEQLDYCRRNFIRVNRANGTFKPNHLDNPLPFTTRSKKLIQEFKGKVKTLGIRTSMGRTFWLVKRKVFGPGYPHLHTNGCGDFTLLSKDVWFSLRGYPELDIFSMHLDSFTCHAAHQAGAKELVLQDPMAIYHIEHASGSGWTPEGEAKLNARLAEAGVPQVSFPQFEEWARQMNRERKALVFADEDWGLAKEDLRETVISPGGVVRCSASSASPGA